MEVPSFTTGSKPNETVSKNLWKGSGVELSIHARTHRKQINMGCTKLWAVKVLVFHKQYLKSNDAVLKLQAPPQVLDWAMVSFWFYIWVHFDSFHPTKQNKNLQTPCLTQHGMTWSNNSSYFQFLVCVKIWHTQYYKCNKWMWRIFLHGHILRSFPSSWAMLVIGTRHWRKSKRSCFILHLMSNNHLVVRIDLTHGGCMIF